MKVRDYIKKHISIINILIALFTLAFSVGTTVFFVGNNSGVNSEKLLAVEKNIADIKKNIAEIKEDISDLRSQHSQLESLVSENSNKILNLNDTFNGYKVLNNIQIGLIDESNNSGELTCYGLEYKPMYKTCEINGSSQLWQNINNYPNKGKFIEIENTEGNKTTCIVIGQFSDSDNQNRLVIISSKAAEYLNFNVNQGIQIASIRVLSDLEWTVSENLKYRHNEVYKFN